MAVMGVLVIGLSIAQDHGSKNKPTQAEHAKIEALKRTYFSEELDLSKEDSLAFWPVYDDYSKRLRDLHHEIKSKYKCKDGSDLSEAEYKKLVEEIIVLEKKEVNLKAEFMLKVGALIGYEKSLKLPCLEHEFRKKLLHELRERKKTR